jgi:hypothetical protein
VNKHQLKNSLEVKSDDFHHRTVLGYICDTKFSELAEKLCLKPELNSRDELELTVKFSNEEDVWALVADSGYYRDDAPKVIIYGQWAALDNSSMDRLIAELDWDLPMGTVEFLA